MSANRKREGVLHPAVSQPPWFGRSNGSDTECNIQNDVALFTERLIVAVARQRPHITWRHVFRAQRGALPSALQVRR